MKYWIETERYVALTCDLTEWQANKFFNHVKTKQGSLHVMATGVEGQAFVVLSHKGTVDVFVRDRKPKSKKEFEKEKGYGCWDSGDAKLWNNIKLLDDFFKKFHYVISVKIFPESAIPDDVPDDFIGKKQIHHKDIGDKEKAVCPFIADYLQRAERIRDLHKNRPTPESTSLPTQNQPNGNAPAVPTSPASNFSSTTSRPPVQLRAKKQRTLWVRKQLDDNKSCEQIHDEWNKMSHSQRAATLGIPTDDPDKTRQYEPFKSVSNVTRIKKDYELEEERKTLKNDQYF